MDTKKLNILLLDDDPIDSERVKNLINEVPCDITSTTNLDEAFKACYEFKFSCIVVCYRLGKIGLNDVCVLSNHFSFIPIIFLTDDENELLLKEAMKCGASDYIFNKNLNSEFLIKIITSNIEKFNLQRKVQEQKSKIKYITHHIYHDYLTNIPNRFFFDQTLLKVLASAKRNQRFFAILIIDLDEFKYINDTFGHKVGDILLQDVSKRFQAVIREEDMLARLGGDEFGIVISEMKKKEDADFFAEKLIFSLINPFVMDSHELTITSSIGIAIYPFAGETISELMKNADKAMYQAKNVGKNNFQIYTPSVNQKMEQQLLIETAMREGLTHNEFHVCYQPIYHLNNKSLFGLEALLRWNNKNFSDVSIEEIISIANASGLIVELGDWIINEVFKDYQRWGIKDDSAIHIALNLSLNQINSQNWFSKVQELIAQYHIIPNKLIFELSEADLINHNLLNKKMVSSFAALGIKIFIDRFGSGTFSLKILNNLPISGLKIDKECIKGISENQNDRNLAKSIISFAKNMGLIIVAEGIETKSQLDFLKTFTEGKGQGYYLSRIMSADEVTNLLKL